jgi:hypothetical protein
MTALVPSSSSLDHIFQRIPRRIGNAEIWRKTLSYFEFAIGPYENLVDKRHKRLGALSIALLSRSLSGSALRTLWRTMLNLEPLVCVANASATCGQPYLTFVNQQSVRA